MNNRTNGLRERFRDLHASGCFVMPNAWDVGSARLLVSLGFPALATTSSGHAATLGRLDQHVTRDEMLAHAEQLAGAVDVPLSVDSEHCFAGDAAGVVTTVELIAGTGAAGCSIEDYDPVAGHLYPLDVAIERVVAAAGAAHAHGLVLTARAENHLHGVDDLGDTITRLQAYRDAGADAVYAPGLVDISDIARLVRDVDTAVNVLALPRGPSTSELAAAGVRRISTGGALCFAAYGALMGAARELLDAGTSTYARAGVRRAELASAFTQPAAG
jgi:2-methylisocitrate lyase-like PEP mutase family enzyme